MLNDGLPLKARARYPVLPYAVHAVAWLTVGVAAWGQRSVFGEPITISSLFGYLRWAGTGAMCSAPVLYGLLTRRPWRARAALVPLVVAGGALLAVIPWMVLHTVIRHGIMVDVLALPPSLLVSTISSHVPLMLLWCAGATLILSARDGEQLRRLSVEAQHRLLVAQVNPHFLFNALNSVRALVDENPQGARGMITQLSGFLRGSLSLQPAHRIRYADEMAMQESYLAIEQVRFEERLVVRVSATTNARDAAIPPLLLAPLVENAVTHGRGNPLSVSIDARVVQGTLVVEVRNSGGWRTPSASNGGGLGLANVRERLRLAYGDKAELITRHDVDEVCVALRLPFTRHQA